jgi:hypothetical protein
MENQYVEKIVNVETGEETFREYTAAEIAKVNAAKLELDAKLLEEEQKQEARSVLLNKLGITEEEAKLLLS